MRRLATKKRDDHCEHHGEFISEEIWPNIDRWSSCPTCITEREEIAKIEEAEEKLKREEEEKIRKHKNLLRRSGISLRFHKATFENYEIKTEAQRTTFDAVKKYCEEFEKNYDKGNCFIFAGNCGNGKTHLASALIQDLVYKNFSCYMTRASNISNLVRMKMFDREESRTDAYIDEVDKIFNSNLLVIDEIGNQTDSEFEKRMLFDVIDARYREELPTGIVTNMAPNELTKFLGKPIYDRLLEGEPLMLGFTWESYRLNRGE